MNETLDSCCELDVIEAGDTGSLEHQNARHLNQMKTLLDNHLDQQRSILAEFTEGGKANVREMKKWREEMIKERKVLAKTLATHEAQIDRLSSYADGVFLSHRVYNSNLVVFICLLVANVAFIILTVILWLNK